MGKNATIVNLFGGPGIGKSTMATSIFSLLKMHGVNAEYVSEFAKDLTWDGNLRTLSNQYYVWASQYHRFWRICGLVDIIVTDSPFLLTLVYGDTTKEFKQFVVDMFNNYNNINFILRRTTEYIKEGRNETEKEAQIVDNKIIKTLHNYNIPYHMVTCGYKDVNNVTNMILQKINMPQRYVIKDVDKWTGK